MQRHLPFFAAIFLLGLHLTANAQQAARNKDGKLLFGTDAALRVAEVSSPALSPDKAVSPTLSGLRSNPRASPGRM